MRILVLSLLLFRFCLAEVLVAINPPPSAKPAPTYVVDLDLPPRERWKEALRHFNPDDVKNVFNTFMNNLVHSKALLDLIEILGMDLNRYIPQPFADEMRGVSEVLSMNLGEVVLANLIYDITAFNSTGFKACTSIVAVDKNNKVIHGRNLDYGYSDLLKKLTFQADYRRDKKHLFMATTYAGYIGVITGTRHGAFSITGDERDKGSVWENLLSALEESWPTFFLQRTVLEKAENYKSAVNMLVKQPTIAPVYFIVGGMQPGEGVIIVKNRQNVLNVTSMEQHGWYVLETNYDPWNPPPASDDRRDAGIAAMNKVGKSSMDPTQLYNVLSTHLVFNEQTTYTTIMSASDRNVYHTMIRYDMPV